MSGNKMCPNWTSQPPTASRAYQGSAGVSGLCTHKYLKKGQSIKNFLTKVQHNKVKQ